MPFGRHGLKAPHADKAMKMSKRSRLISNLRRVTSRRAFEFAGGKRILPPQSAVALMFTDIEAFTPITLALKEKAIHLLGLYFGAMSEYIYQAGGDIDKFIGDSIFAYFFDPQAPENAVNIAFDTAITMSNADMAFADNPEWQQCQRFKTRFGLHWGEVVAGSFGSEQRADSTLLGDNVNLAARMESLNKKYQSYILLTDDFYRKLSTKRKTQCRLLDRVAVAGREEHPLDIYVADLNPLPKSFLKLFGKALQYYFSGDWQSAHQTFAEARKVLANDGLPDDGPTNALLNRIEKTNLFWKKALRHFGDNVPEIMTPEIVSAITEKLTEKKYLAPMDWPGHWRYLEK